MASAGVRVSRGEGEPGGSGRSVDGRGEVQKSTLGVAIVPTEQHPSTYIDMFSEKKCAISR